MNGPVLAIIIVVALAVVLVLAALVRGTGWAIRHAAKAEQVAELAHARMDVRGDPELPVAARAELAPGPEEEVTFLHEYRRTVVRTAAAVAIGVGGALLLVGNHEPELDASPPVPVTPSPMLPPPTTTQSPPTAGSLPDAGAPEARCRR